VKSGKNKPVLTGATIGGKEAEYILDIVVPEGQSGVLNELIDYGKDKGVSVNIREF
jgi:hypothetical protein